MRIFLNETNNANFCRFYKYFLNIANNYRMCELFANIWQINGFPSSNIVNILLILIQLTHIHLPFRTFNCQSKAHVKLKALLCTRYICSVRFITIKKLVIFSHEFSKNIANMQIFQKFLVNFANICNILRMCTFSTNISNFSIIN